MHRIGPWLLALGLAVAACSNASTVDVSAVPELAPASPEEVVSRIVAGGQPAVVNIWASWCVPCRSEAPLLRTAHEQLGDEVLFLGVDVQDRQAGARAFIAEFGLDGFDHLFDPDRTVPSAFGQRGVPITFFFGADGEVASAHSGVIDERTLAASIDELIGR